MFNILAQFNHKAEIRESKDEILVGEIVAAMAAAGYPSIAFRAHNDRQLVQFKAIQDPILHTINIILDRKTGTGALGSAVFGSKATLRITAEVRNRMTDPDDLIAMYKTDLANLFKMPAMGGIKLNHELNSVFATTQRLIEIDDYVLKGEPGVVKMRSLLEEIIGALREKLREYHR
jgi:hypothetical protein